MDLNSVFKKYFYPAMDIPSFRKPDVCKSCGGLCCKGCGCHIAPQDLLVISKESIINLIDESGCVSIDWWEGNPLTNKHTEERVYYLRIRNADKQIIDPAFDPNSCSIVTDKGCPLDFEYRPRGGRELLPVDGKDKQCIIGYSKQDCCIDWMKHQDILTEVYEHYHKLGLENVFNPEENINTLFKYLFNFMA